jgi:iron complex transport system permease protein
MVGAALALSGALLQGLLRNPLADPGVLGVTSFAGLGAAMAYLFLPVGLLFVPGAAFIFALIAAGAIALFASRKSTGGSEHLVLCGIALGTTATALLSVCMLLSRDDVMPLIAWIVGSISGKSWGTLATSGTLCLTGIGAALSLGGKLNVIQLGESTARSLGLNYRLLRVVIIVVASLLVAVSASLAGLVGFVGLIVPHLARMICGDDYRFLLPLSAILGGALVVGGDLVARSVLAPTELPVGAVTALCGGPFFFYLILRPKQSKLCPALH